MKINNIEIDYGDIIFSKRHEIDKKAYSKYYDENYNINSNLYTFNGFYGTELHKKYANIILRKQKLEKLYDINKS